MSKITGGISAAHEEGEGDHADSAEQICESCGRPMAMKDGRFGQFLACTGYPLCKHTRKVRKAGGFVASDVVLDKACPKCGEHLVLKQGRYGAFTACSNYPKCKFIMQETTGVSCPECGAGQLVVKRSKRGAFYGCSDYPACKFTLRDRPVPQSCPQCAARFLVEHNRKGGGYVLQCRAEGCKYKEARHEITIESH